MRWWGLPAESAATWFALVALALGGAHLVALAWTRGRRPFPSVGFVVAAALVGVVVAVVQVGPAVARIGARSPLLALTSGSLLALGTAAVAAAMALAWLGAVRGAALGLKHLHASRTERRRSTPRPRPAAVAKGRRPWRRHAPVEPGDGPR